MGALRKQMDADMVVRGMAVRTRESYLAAVAGLAKYYGRSPEQVSEAEVQRYLLHLMEERKLAWSSCNIAVSGLRFLYHTTLKRREAQFDIPRARAPQKLPQILSREEIARLIELTANPKHRAILMSAYGAGLRLSELCQLKVGDIDSARMSIRVEQGKGAKDRYTLLSARLLAELRRYWIAYRPKLWLFTGVRDRERPISDHSVQRLFYAAKASPRSAASTACAMPSPPTCWKPGSMCTPSSGSWATGTSARPCATFTWRTNTWRPPPRRWTCWIGPIPRASRLRWERIRTQRMRQAASSSSRTS
jgi:integrase